MAAAIAVAAGTTLLSPAPQSHAACQAMTPQQDIQSQVQSWTPQQYLDWAKAQGCFPAGANTQIPAQYQKPPPVTGPIPDPNRIELPPTPPPATMLKEDCDKLQNDINVLNSKDPLGMGATAFELAADVPVGLAVITALGICGTLGVNDVVQAAVGDMVGRMVRPMLRP